MEALQITINNKNFILAFGMKFFRILGQRLGTDTLLRTQQAVLVVLQTFDAKNKDLSFEQLDMINHLIQAAIVSNDENAEKVSDKELDDLVFADTKGYLEIVTKIMSGFVASLPKSDTPATAGKPKAPRKQVSKKN